PSHTSLLGASICTPSLRTLFPYTSLFRSVGVIVRVAGTIVMVGPERAPIAAVFDRHIVDPVRVPGVACQVEISRVVHNRAGGIELGTGHIWTQVTSRSCLML